MHYFEAQSMMRNIGNGASVKLVATVNGRLPRVVEYKTYITSE